MRLPDKITPYDDSVLPLLLKILKQLIDCEKSPTALFAQLKGADTSEFIEAMDCLYALGKIDFTDDGRGIRYVGRDLLR